MSKKSCYNCVCGAVCEYHKKIMDSKIAILFEDKIEGQKRLHQFIAKECVYYGRVKE